MAMIHYDAVIRTKDSGKVQANVTVRQAETHTWTERDGVTCWGCAQITRPPSHTSSSPEILARVGPCAQTHAVDWKS